MIGFHKILLSTACAFLLLALSFTTRAQSGYKPATLIDSEPLGYPTMAKKDWLEGWAYYHYTITPEGKVSDIEILDSNEVKVLNSALKRHIESMTFEPATRDGVPVAQHSDVKKMVFLLRNKPRTAEYEFVRKYRHSMRHFKKGRLEKGRALIDELAAESNRSLYEELYLQILYAEYYKLSGKPEKEMQHIQRLLEFRSIGEHEILKHATTLLAYLLRAYQISLLNSRLGDAFYYLDQLNDVVTSNPDLEKKYHQAVQNLGDQRQELLRKIDGNAYHMTINLPKPLFGSEYGSMAVRLLRRELQIIEVAGRLDELLVACENGNRSHLNPGDGTWRIPPSWGKCEMGFKGLPDTEVTLASLPPGTLTAPDSDSDEAAQH